MPAEFLDGPAERIALDLRRCPTYLRVTKSERQAEGEIGGTHPVVRWDALDQPGDVAEDGEEILVYKIEEGTWGFVFACGPKRSQGGRYEYGQYRHVDVSDELRQAFRERLVFMAWAVLHHARGGGVNAISARAAAELAQQDVDAFRRHATAIGAERVGEDLWRLP